MYRPPANATIPVRLVLDNQMGSHFRFERILLLVDDGSVLTREQHESIRDHVRSGGTATIGIRVTPGEHVIRMLVEFIGEGQGTFAYLKGYKFEIRSSRGFTAVPDGEVRIITYEQNAAALEERPAVRYAETYPPGSAPPAPTCSCPCK